MRSSDHLPRPESLLPEGQRYDAPLLGSRPRHPVVVGLGANLPSCAGAPEDTITAAFSAVEEALQAHAPRRSALYASAPVGPVAQPDFVNAALCGFTSLAPLEALDALLGVERRFGRERRERWGPRTLDLDLLLYGACELRHPRLCLPHPRLAERGFALVPAAEVAPQWRLPGGASVEALASGWQAGAAPTALRRLGPSARPAPPPVEGAA